LRSIRPHSAIPYLQVDVGVGDDSGRLEPIGQGVRPLLDLPVGEVRSAGLDPQVRVLGDPDATGGVEVGGTRRGVLARPLVSAETRSRRGGGLTVGARSGFLRSRSTSG
jgi:hypothetical protein